MAVLSVESVSGRYGAWWHRFGSGYGRFNPYNGPYPHGWTPFTPRITVPEHSLICWALCAPDHL
jgi:hypothetical protein